jgi:hypothetical protein
MDPLFLAIGAGLVFAFVWPSAIKRVGTDPALRTGSVDVGGSVEPAIFADMPKLRNFVNGAGWAAMTALWVAVYATGGLPFLWIPLIAIGAVATMGALVTGLRPGYLAVSRSGISLRSLGASAFLPWHAVGRTETAGGALLGSKLLVIWKANDTIRKSGLSGLQFPAPKRDAELGIRLDAYKPPGEQVLALLTHFIENPDRRSSIGVVNQASIAAE